MKRELNRRDFLKLGSWLSLAASTGLVGKWIDVKNSIQRKHQNVIIIVFDAFSGYHIPANGYGRPTTPNIDRLAKRAIVYHNHYAGGSFTSPGTASLLTGVLPWTHRAFRPNSEVTKSFESRNIFSAFPNYHRIAFSHNGWAYTLLKQFNPHIDELIPMDELLLNSPYDRMIHKLFKNDDDIASVSWLRAMDIGEEGYAYSLFLSQLYEKYQANQVKQLIASFPRGIPGWGSDHFILETATQAAGKRLSNGPQPFLAYFHFLPPHAPYRTTVEFFNAFKDDGYRPLQKPIDVFGSDIGNLSLKRREYDEFILYCDKEFGRLFDLLESSGILENTWLVLTSDHGEMNERGITGHMTDALYQPVVRIPLMIFEPGRETGMDVYEPTSAIDLLPTLMHLTGGTAPEWTEGLVLPPFGLTSGISQRSLYLLRANHNDQFAPFTIASTMLVRESYKLHYYFGYPLVGSDGLVRLYDVKADPEEMTDLAQSKPDTAAELLNELRNKLKEVNAPYL
jgi:Arylsulfatase A and related enzymes